MSGPGAEALALKPAGTLAIPVDRPSAQGDRVEAIYAAVQRAVLEQRLAPGTKLPEDQLGVAFGTSRTLVRAALLALSRDGIVVLTRHRGASVASPGPEEARQLFDARRVVEAELTARAAFRADPADITALQALVEDGSAALEAGDRGRAIRLSGLFHTRIAAIADQSVLGEFLNQLVARTSLVIALYGRAWRADCRDSDHRELITALARHDAASAVSLMREHLHHVEADLDLTSDRAAPVSLASIFANADASLKR